MRGAAAHAAAALLAGAPIRLWLGIGDGVKAARAGGAGGGMAISKAGGLAERVKDMVGAVHLVLSVALATDSVQLATTTTAAAASTASVSAMLPIMDCVQALLAVTPYAPLEPADVRDSSTPSAARIKRNSGTCVFAWPSRNVVLV